MLPVSWRHTWAWATQARTTSCDERLRRSDRYHDRPAGTARLAASFDVVEHLKALVPLACRHGCQTANDSHWQ